MGDWLQNLIFEKLIKGLLIKKIIGWIDETLKKLPGDERKTVTGFITAALMLLVQELPVVSDYGQPVLDMLHTLPTEQVAAGGILWGALGLFHKALKWIRKVTGTQSDKPVVIEATVRPSELKKIA